MGWEMSDCYVGETDELASGRHYHNKYSTPVSLSSNFGVTQTLN